MVGNEEPELWRTGPVVKRISSRVLCTENGSIYRLQGTIQDKLMGPNREYAQCLNKATICKFTEGFPRSWKSLITSSEMSTPK